MGEYALHILKLNVIAACMIMLVKVLAVFFKGKLTARWKYVLWLVLAVSLLIPVRIPEGLSVFRLQINTSRAKNEVQQDRGQMLSGQAAGDGSSGDTQKEKAASVSAPEKEVVFPISINHFLGFFLVLWLAVAVIRFFHSAVCYGVSMKNIKRMSVPVQNMNILRMYSAAYHAYGISNPPILMQNAGISTPLLAGIRKTRLFLPAGGYTAEELKLIFRHELSHYRHRDLWYKMLLQLCSTIYWFNPFLLLMLKEADNDIENLCDTAVVCASNENENRLYRKLLLKTAAFQNQIPYVSASLNDSTMVFKDRILYMVRLRRLSRNVLPGVLLALLLIFMNFAFTFSVSAGEKVSAVSEEVKPTESLVNAEKMQAEKAAEPVQKAEEPIQKPEEPAQKSEKENQAVSGEGSALHNETDTENHMQGQKTDDNGGWQAETGDTGAAENYGNNAGTDNDNGNDTETGNNTAGTDENDKTGEIEGDRSDNISDNSDNIPDNTDTSAGIDDPYDLYSWDPGTDSFIPFQQAGGEGSPIGKGSGWYYYDAETGNFVLY